MVADVADFEPGGGRSEGVGSLLQGSSLVGVAVRAETWLLTLRMEPALSIFHHRVVQRLFRRQKSRLGGGIWDYPPLAAAMTEAGFEDIGTYVTRRQKTVAQYIAT